MKKTFAVCFILIALNMAHGNDLYLKKEPVDNSDIKPKKVFAGGDLGMTFGEFTELRISPMIGYNFSKEVLGGVRFDFRLSWDKVVNQNTGSETTENENSIGGTAFLMYTPLKNIYLNGEYSYQVYKNPTSQNPDDTYNVPFIFLGLGYIESISQNAFINAGIKVDVLNHTDSPFENFTPFFDVGIGFQL